MLTIPWPGDEKVLQMADRAAPVGVCTISRPGLWPKDPHRLSALLCSPTCATATPTPGWPPDSAIGSATAWRCPQGGRPARRSAGLHDFDGTLVAIDRVADQRHY